MHNTNLNDIKRVLTRGVAEVLPKVDTLAKLMQKRSIKLYLGIDPTGAFLTLGHGVVLRKLQQFADLGHEVILLIGNGTVRIGDPTGRDSTRPVLTDDQIKANFEDWKRQASKVLDFDTIEIKYNGDWLDPLTYADMVNLLGKVTVQQLLERDMFQQRMKKGQPIFGHEILYPMLQGYDSVAMEVDLELGGTDQTFNMLMGRHLLRTYKDKEKWVLSTPIINGTDGRKMSKSYDNYIALTDEPKEMFGKIMSMKDEEMMTYFEIFTDIDLLEAKKLIEKNPRDAKVRLAGDIVTWLHDASAATEALSDFETKFVKKEIPDDMPEFKVSSPTPILEVLTSVTSFAGGTTEARRLIDQGGVSLDGVKIITLDENISGSPKGRILKVGKRKWGRLLA
ncbi:MAG TPA: tyrosine--tRNA ligase [Candidatus Gracilibacteria bacterium]